MRSHFFLRHLEIPSLSSPSFFLCVFQPFSAKKIPKGGHLENKNAASGSEIAARGAGGEESKEAEGGGASPSPVVAKEFASDRNFKFNRSEFFVRDQKE